MATELKVLEYVLSPEVKEMGMGALQLLKQVVGLTLINPPRHRMEISFLAGLLASTRRSDAVHYSDILSRPWIARVSCGFVSKCGVCVWPNAGGCSVLWRPFKAIQKGHPSNKTHPVSACVHLPFPHGPDLAGA